MAAADAWENVCRLVFALCQKSWEADYCGSKFWRAKRLFLFTVLFSSSFATQNYRFAGATQLFGLVSKLDRTSCDCVAAVFSAVTSSIMLTSLSLEPHLARCAKFFLWVSSLADCAWKCLSNVIAREKRFASFLLQSFWSAETRWPRKISQTSLVFILTLATPAIETKYFCLRSHFELNIDLAVGVSSFSRVNTCWLEQQLSMSAIDCADKNLFSCTSAPRTRALMTRVELFLSFPPFVF